MRVLQAWGILTLPGFDYKRLRVEEMKAHGEL